MYRSIYFEVFANLSRTADAQDGYLRTSSVFYHWYHPPPHSNCCRLAVLYSSMFQYCYHDFDGLAWYKITWIKVFEINWTLVRWMKTEWVKRDILDDTLLACRLSGTDAAQYKLGPSLNNLIWILDIGRIGVDWSSRLWIPLLYYWLDWMIVIHWRLLIEKVSSGIEDIWKLSFPPTITSIQQIVK
jgi:hypothetical protein